MSFNRGMKRDSFGNRSSFNNRSGGGGNNRSGNMAGGGSGSGVNLGMGSGMNPWESGMMPGRGILPTPNNNLSLASPQAQLAIASNLLSNLLRTQQETQPQVPSLLSLGNNFGPGPNYSSTQNYSTGRYNDRPGRNSMKNQRSQPYNKMGNNRARDGVTGRRGPSSTQQSSRVTQSGNQRNGNQNQHRNDKSSKANSTSSQKQNQAIRKEQQDVKNSDNEKPDETPVAKSDGSETSEQTKRDWKDEKKESEEKVAVKEEEKENKDESMKEEPTEKQDDKNQEKEENEKKTFDGKESKEQTSGSDKNSKTSGKKSEVKHAESRYAEVPMSNMVCHVCNKHMWDGYSFENHLRGRAHQLMMEKLDESYKLKVDLMRHELRVAEEQRELTLNNSKRRGKKVSIDLNVREYCTMCDLNFYGTLSSHRKSEKHQQLKTFLHPRCFPCVKEFPSRIEYDEHCLTPTHMKNVIQSEEQRKNKKKDKLPKGEAEVKNAEEEDKDVGTTDTKAVEKEEEPEEEYVTDIPETVTDKKMKIPSYKYCRQNAITIGKSMVKEVKGYHCEKCRRFMLLEEDMNSHLRSITHYRHFAQEIKALINEENNANAKSAEESESTKKESNEESAENANGDCESNCKRLKIEHSEDEESAEAKEKKKDAASNEEQSSAANNKKTSDGEEKYDPLEADAESEEEDANSQQKPEEAKQEEVESTTAEKKASPVDKVWGEDNENDMEVGNLIDDETDDKSAINGNSSPKVELNNSNVSSPQAKSTPRGRGYMRARGSGRARRSRR